MTSKKNGYITLIACILVPTIFLCLGLLTFSLLKTRHKAQLQTECRDQYHQYFSILKSQIQTLEELNPLAVSLYETQLALLPFIWIPSVAKVYQKLQNLRQKFDKFQNTLIRSFAKLNIVKGYAVVGSIQRKLYSENNKIKNILKHKSHLTFDFKSELQIVKKLNIIFPPYTHSPEIAQKQAFKIQMFSQIHSRSWIRFFEIPEIQEKYQCRATLKPVLQDQLIIEYTI